jgi:hypothetical protein
MDYRIGYRRRQSASRLVGKKRWLVWLALGMAMLAMVAAVAWALDLGSDPKKARGQTSDKAAPSELAQSPNEATRWVYPFSIVPGGVASREDIARIVAADTVVSEHYASFNVKNASAVLVGKPRWAHVSYRKDDKVYWTSKKVLLSPGETVLTDGAHEIRGRCGNRISDAAMLPVLENEPDLDVPKLVRGYDESWGGLPNASPSIGAPLPAPLGRGERQLANLGPGVFGPARFFAPDFGLPPGDFTPPATEIPQPGFPLVPNEAPEPGSPLSPNEMPPTGSPVPPSEAPQPGSPVPPNETPQPGSPVPPTEAPPPGSPVPPNETPQPGSPVPPNETPQPGSPVPPNETPQPGSPVPPSETPQPGSPPPPPPTEVPEPGSLWLVAIALAMMMAARRARQHKA